VKSAFSYPVRIVAILTAILFAWNQIVWADGIQSVQPYDPETSQPTTSAISQDPPVAPETLSLPETTQDFLTSDFPLSPATPESPDGQGGGEPLQTETTADGHTLFHVYENESIQEAINGASVGDTVFLHAGIYNQSVTLRQGVNLKGEDSATVILDGQGMFRDVILAQGDNLIEGITVKGGAPYAGPKSAIRIEGNNVILRNSRVVDNADYGVYLRSGNNILIERVFFQNNHLAIQHPSAAATNVVIRYNTMVNNSIGINILSGVTPRIENNIITGSSFCAIYEFNWNAYATGQLSRGFAVLENNVFSGNAWRPTAYGSSTPPVVENSAAGNITADPQFNSDYSIPETSPAYGKGAFLPAAFLWAVNRADQFNVSYSIQTIFENGTAKGFRILYTEGSHEEFYNNGAMVLDITPPQISFSSTSIFTNQVDYEFVYIVDNIEKKEFYHLNPGQNPITLEAVDIFGNKASQTVIVMLDQVAPTGTLTINDGDQETNSRFVVLSFDIQDDSPLKDVRFSLDGGNSWMDWEEFAASKVITFSEDEGEKEILCQLRDAAGNSASFSDVIRFTMSPSKPAIQFLSPSTATNPLYLLRYTVNGVERQETWQLQPGENHLMVCSSFGTLPAFGDHVVVLDQEETPLPEMPVFSGLPSALTSVTASNGLIFKYDPSTLVAIEKTGEYTLFNLIFDAQNNLTGGVLLFENGDQLLFQNNKPIYRLAQSGERTVYNEDGSVAYVLTVDNKKIRFAYHVDISGKVIGIASFEETATSLYDEKGRPVWIKKSGGISILFQDGFLNTYTDAAGNVFHYEVSILREGNDLIGYRSELVSVALSGTSVEMPIATVLNDLESYPSIKPTIEEEISKTIEYDAAGNMKTVISGKGEILRLAAQLPEALTNNAGEIFQFQSSILQDNEWFSMASDQGSLEQIFDAQGQLAGIRLSDGTVFDISALSLNEIRLEDGSILSQLVWNGQNLTGFRRQNTDGSADIYQNSYLMEHVDPEGNRTLYILYKEPGKPTQHKPSEIHMADGRTYKVIEFKNASGALERINELTSITLPDGGKVEFENGVPVRYIQYQEVRLDAETLPELPNGQSYIPSLTFPELELRGITIDATGNILSGEILYRDGTQHLIKNGVLYKQITPGGQIVEFNENFENTWDPPQATLPQPLTQEELAYRNALIEAQLDYFKEGVGLHQLTGLPLDNYQTGAAEPADYSQATLVGFWAEILVAIATGDYVTSKMTQEEALSKLENLLAAYRQAQLEAGWNGMLAFFTIVESQEEILDSQGLPTGEMRTVIHYENRFNQYGFGDTLNLSVSLASVIGALEGRSLGASLDIFKNNILETANNILTDQEAGYAAFYDPSKKRFHGSYAKDPATGTWKFVKDFYIDRVFSEFRTGLIWLAAKYPQYQEAVNAIDVAFRSYQSESGEVVDNVAPWDGGAFQMFWPQIHVDETQYPEFAVALRNFLYTQAEFVNQNDIAGLLSAGADPGQGYEGKIGVPYAAETDDPLHTDIGSLYGLASAFSVAPHYVLQFFKNIEAAIPGVLTGAGFADSVKFLTETSTDPVSGEELITRTPVLATEYFGVDQASFVLSLLQTSRSYFSNYLNQTNTKNSFDNLYRSFQFNLTPVEKNLPPPPDFGLTQENLYTGSETNPDGNGYPLVKEDAFISSLFDPEYGEGHIYNYRTPSGAFHHTGIEFLSSAGETVSMGLQEFLLLPGRRDAARSLFESLNFDLFDQAKAQGAFYTPGYGFANGALAYVPPMGEVQTVQFDFRDVTRPVGLWAQFQGIDLNNFDFISVPIKLDLNTDVAMRLKFELKGMGEVFITPELTHEWQYIQVPIKKPSSLLTEIAVVAQSMDGSPIKGEFLLGPLSTFKIRTNNTIDWQSLIGKTNAQLQNLLKSAALEQPSSGGIVTKEEILEDFVIDSQGKLVSGILRKANGEIQYYQSGQLMKWVFPSGRTVLFENGLATFVVDLARGQLEESRFYYDQDLRGQLHSFVIQENDRKRVFNAQGELELLVEEGFLAHFEQGEILSIETPTATLTNIVLADDLRILTAHVKMKNGSEFDIDQTQEQAVSFSDGVKLFYSNREVTAIETPSNGRTELQYDYDALGRLMGVNVSFQEVGSSAVVEMSLSDFLNLPSREVEKTYLLKEGALDLDSVSSILGYSVGGTVNHLWLDARKEGGSFYNGWACTEPACWNFGYNANTPTIGMAFNYAAPVNLSDYDFLSVTIRLDPGVTWPQDFVLSVKDGYWARFSYAIQGLTEEYQTFTIPLAGKTWAMNQLTLEIQGGDHDPLAYGSMGKVFLEDVSFFSIHDGENPIWEAQAGITDAQIQNLKIESDNLNSVGAHIASQTPLQYEALRAFLDLPTYMIYQQETSGSDFQLEHFRRFDGSQIDLEGQNVSRVILPDGTINEYSATGNTAEGTILDPGNGVSDIGNINYSYGALRRITQADGRQYELSYEFDPGGAEITVFRDILTGEVRRFKGGKLISATDPNQIQTHYLYENGELIGAELTYHNRVLNSTQYFFNGEETQVTDERGTTWFYDKDGKLLKHMTRDGFLYEYSEFTQPLSEGQTVDPDDYKNAVYAGNGLTAVTLKGYQAPNGSWILWDEEHGSEIHLASGAQGVNLVFDGEQKIQSGQIQFPDGMLLEIENYIPVRGRLASGETFEYTLPQATDHEILQGPDGSYLGFCFKIGTTRFTYSPLGELVKTESEDGVTHLFTYTRNRWGDIINYTNLERRQIAFNGVPFPKEVKLIAGTDQKLMDSGNEIAVHNGNGFIVGIYKESANQWDVYSGSFASEADRIGLRHFLSEIKTGDFVAMTVSDSAFSQVDEEIFSLLEGMGAGAVRQAAASNSSWSFFGNENLNLGEGREAVGVNSFSTLTETSRFESLIRNQNLFFQNAPMSLNIAPEISAGFSQFLKDYLPLKAARDLQAVTVYNKQDEIVFSRRLDGINSYYEFGKVRETFDGNGELLSVHEYVCPETGCHSAEDMALKKITLVKSRQDFEAQAIELSEQIEQAKFEALYRLAWQDEVARAQIKENVDAGVAQINAQISSLESQRFKKVKECRSFLFWKHCEERTYEVPGVQSAINQLAGQRAELVRTGEEQLAAIPGAMAAKQIEIEQATAQKMAELVAQKEAFLLDILREEMEPIITDFYRRILGRDASEEEFNSWVDRYKEAGALDIQILQTELQTSEEKILREAQKTAIIENIRTLLNTYVAGTPEEKSAILQTLHLEASEAVDLNAEDVNKILEWLESRDLHFGQSAFLSLKEMLASKGVDVPVETIGKEAILIDILAGVITRFTEGDILISTFALNRTAAIHGQEFTTVKYSYQDLLALYQSVCPDLASACPLRVIAHIDEDHFVVIKKVTDTEVIYEETNKGANGSDVTISRENFLRVWTAENDAGHLIVSQEQALETQRLSDQEAMRIRGSFFGIDDLIFWAFVASMVFTVASVAVSFFSPALGKILGYAALVAGIVGIVASIGQFVVQGLKMVFSSISSQGFFSTIKQGLAYVGKVLWAPVKAVGQFIQNGFQFLTSGFSAGFGSFGSGIAQIKDFLLVGANEIYKDGVLIGREFTFSQIAARQLVAAGLNMGVSSGLEGLGLDPQLCQLAGAFVGGGFLGIGQAGSSFIRSGLQNFALQGVSQLGLRLGLAPPIASALSLVASTSLTALFDGSFNLKTFSDIAPTLASQLTMGGMELIGRSLGLDPRITQLLGLPISSIVGNITARFSGTVIGYRDDGTPIYVTSQYDTGSLWDSIKNSLVNGIQQIGFVFGGESTNSIFGSLLSSSILNSVGSILGSEGLFNGILDILKTTVLAPLNLINGIVQTTIQGLRNFNDLIQEKGLIGAFESLATSIFSRSALEKLLGFGGISGFLGSAAKNLTTLANGQQVQEQKVDGSTSLYYDLFGNFIGKKENGVTQIGTFGINSVGKWALLAGTFISNVVADWAFAGEVNNGQLKSGKLYQNGTLVGEFTPENNDGSIIINGSHPDAQRFSSSGGFWGMVFKFIPYAMEFVFNGGLLQGVNFTSGSSQNTDSNKPFFVLANGVGNPSATGSPDYINNLTSDLQTSSNGQIAYDDIIKPPLYNALLNGGTTDQVKDILHWIAESNTPYIRLDLVGKIQVWMNAWKQVIASRPVVGVGFSGGFEPLVESLIGSTYNVATLVSLAGIIGSLAGISTEVLNLIITVADQIESGTVDGLRGFLDTLFSKIPVVGDVVQLATSIVDFVNDHSIGLAFDTLKAALMAFLQALPPAIPPVISPSAGVLVNLYGTEDILYKLNLVGFRDSIADFTPDNEDRMLFNIEIVGATHSGYMRRDNPSLNQPAVNAFVTEMILHSKSETELSTFLLGNSHVFFDSSRQVWVVNP